jgi:glucuronoarabinoxylan endo-1,4-beta-xylanase
VTKLKTGSGWVSRVSVNRGAPHTELVSRASVNFPVFRLRLLLGMLLLVGVSIWLWARSRSQPAIIDWTELHQEIDGFGASSATDMPELNELTDARADMFFDPVKGIGLSLLRTQIQPDGSSLEIVTAQKAAARGAKVWATPWSPPANYKTNGTLENGGYLIPSDYPAWAAVLAGYVKLMQSKGVPIYALSMQNEPDIPETYSSCLYSAQNIHDFVPHLYSAFQSNGVSDTRIIIAEQYHWAFDLTDVAMADPYVAQHVSIIAAHGYGNERILAHNSGNAHLWETEDSGAPTKRKFDGSIRDGLMWASEIHQFLTVANVNAWHWWTLMTDEDDNGGLTDMHGSPAKRMYILGNWSKFVRPGWHRIGANFSASIQVSAFKDPESRAFAIVAINTNRFPIAQTVSLQGFSTDSIIPWITSNNLSLAPQVPVAVKGSKFTYRLPASSVTTFTGTAHAAQPF